MPFKGTRLLSVAFIMFALSNCATVTKITSVRNPSYPTFNIKSIIVYAPYDNLDLRKNAEYEFVAAFANNSVAAYAAFDLMPPIKGYAKEDVQNIIDGFNVGTVLFITFKEAGESSSNLSLGKASLIDTLMFYQQNPISAATKKGELFDLRVFSKDQTECIWMATTKAISKGYSSAAFYQSLGLRTVNAMAEDNLIKPAQSNDLLIKARVLDVQDSTISVKLNAITENFCLFGLLEAQLNLGGITNGQNVMAEIITPFSRDRQGRLVAYIFDSNLWNLNVELLREGKAKLEFKDEKDAMLQLLKKHDLDFSSAKNKKRVERMLKYIKPMIQAENEAKAKKAGIWK